MNPLIFAKWGPTIGAQLQGIDELSPAAWPLLPRTLLYFGLYCVSVGALWFYPLSNYAERLRQSVLIEDTLRAEFTDKMVKAAKLNPLKKKREAIALAVEKLEKQLPHRTEMSGLLFSISQMGRGHNLQQELFKPGAPQIKPHYAVVPVTFRAKGRYHDFARFAADLASLPRMVNLSNMTITPNAEGTLSLEVTVRTYRQLEPAEVAMPVHEVKEGR
jgi:type IV pilus assembly protein PilO